MAGNLCSTVSSCMDDENFPHAALKAILNSIVPVSPYNVLVSSVNVMNQRRVYLVYTSGYLTESNK